jgi:hypothetical protein
MSEVFELSRFIRLLKKSWTDERRKYVLSMLVAFGLLIGGFLFALITSEKPKTLGFTSQIVLYSMGLYALGLLFAGTWFSQLGDKPKGISYLMLPASHFEKILVAFLFNVLFFLAFYNIMFWVVDQAMIGLNNLYLKEWNSGHPENQVVMRKPLSMIESDVILALLNFLIFQAIFVFCSVFFERMSLLKSILMTLLLVTVVTFILSSVQGFFLPDDQWMFFSFTEWRHFLQNGKLEAVRLSPQINKLITGAYFVGVPLFIWVITYFRIREKQI